MCNGIFRKFIPEEHLCVTEIANQAARERSQISCSGPKCFREGAKGLGRHRNRRFVARAQTLFAQAQVTFGRLLAPRPQGNFQSFVLIWLSAWCSGLQNWNLTLQEVHSKYQKFMYPLTRNYYENNSLIFFRKFRGILCSQNLRKRKFFFKELRVKFAIFQKHLFRVIFRK